jgi:hypothetical protein
MLDLLILAKVKMKHVEEIDLKDYRTEAKLLKLKEGAYAAAKKYRNNTNQWEQYNKIFPDQQFPEQIEMNRLLKELRYAFYEIFPRVKKKGSGKGEGSQEASGTDSNPSQ